MARRWICGAGLQPVRVVHGDGQVLSVLPPVKVADILVNYPHHYICHMSPELPTNKSPMLSLDWELEPGYLYFLLPLPRLFPTSSAGPPSCCCRASSHNTSIEEGHTTPSRDWNVNNFPFPSPLRIKAVQRMMDRIGSPVRTAKKKVSPELSRSPATSSAKEAKSPLTSPLLSPTYGSSKSSKRRRGIGSSSRGCRSPRSSPNRSRENTPSPKSQKGTTRDGGWSFMEDLCSLKWKPGLGCISETDAAVTACEELRLCLDRRRLTFDSKVPRYNSSARLADAYRLHGRERIPQKDDAYSNKPARPMLEDGYNDRPMGVHMALGNYIFA